MAAQIQMSTRDLGPGRVRVHLAGRLDVAGSGEIDLRFSALCGAHEEVLVDLSELTFLASIGIRTLLLGARTVRKRGGKLLLVNPRPEIEEVLTVSGVTEIMPVCRSPDEDLQSRGA